jgi:ADP-heptose:LPS heptosyltransferase
MHIVDALQVPNVVMFAGTEYECQWRPRYSPSRLLRRPTVCSPCYAFACPYHLECLDIEPEAIVQAALSVLEPVLKPVLEPVLEPELPFVENC